RGCAASARGAGGRPTGTRQVARLPVRRSTNGGVATRGAPPHRGKSSLDRRIAGEGAPCTVISLFWHTAHTTVLIGNLNMAHCTCTATLQQYGFARTIS